MTVSEALRSIHKKRCAACSCLHCVYLAGECDDPEIKEIVELLHLHPLTFRVENGRKVAYAHDGSGSIIYPSDFKSKPDKPVKLDTDDALIAYIRDLGLMD